LRNTAELRGALPFLAADRPPHTIAALIAPQRLNYVILSAAKDLANK
jgi:hypothetical protein